MYLPVPAGTHARYAELTVYSDTGADVCAGEFRAYGPDPAAAGTDDGVDLSFTPINCPSGQARGGWANLAQLLKAGVAGARAGNPAGRKPLIMMHYDQGADFTDSSAFYSTLEQYAVPFDVTGLSYYPVLSEPSISGLRANVDGLATEFRKPIVTDELSILATAPDGLGAGLFYWAPDWIPGVPRARSTGQRPLRDRGIALHRD